MCELLCLHVRCRGKDECGADCADRCCGYRHVLLASHCLCDTQQKTGTFSLSIFNIRIHTYAHSLFAQMWKDCLGHRSFFVCLFSVSSYNYTPHSAFLLPAWFHAMCVGQPGLDLASHCLSWGKLEPVPAGQETAFTQGRTPIYCGANTGGANIHTHINTYGHFGVVSWPNPHVFGLKSHLGRGRTCQQDPSYC